MIIEPHVFKDRRGSFCELINMEKAPWNGMYFVQNNLSISAKNVFRGLHYQHENPQGKLVTILTGEVFDYIVDLRARSYNFGKVKKYILTEGDMLWVPPCFAHGFLSLKDNTRLMYHIFDAAHMPYDEYSITPYDFPEIAYDLDDKVILSEKDKDGLYLKDAPIYE